VHRGMHPLLHCALVLVATVVVAMMAMATTAKVAMQEVALQRRGDVMAVRDGDKARICAADNASAGTTAEQFACTWAALCSCVSDPLRLAGTVVKVDIDAREVEPSGVDMHG